MPRGLQVFHHDIFVFRIYLGEPVGARQQVGCVVACLRARGLQVRHAPDVGGSPTPRAISLATGNASPVSIFTATPWS